MAGYKGFQGRKSKDENTRVMQTTLTEAGKFAVQRLFYSLRGKDEHGKKPPALSNTMLHACELAIAHAIGTPRQRVEIHQTGELITIHELSRLIRDREKLKELPSPDPKLLISEQVIDVTPVEVIFPYKGEGGEDRHSTG